MPNWCRNYVLVEGPEESLRAFAAAVEAKHGNVFSLDSVIPMPKELLEIRTGWNSTLNAKEWTEGPDGPQPVDTEALKVKYGASNWYDWACNNWGTKWDTNDAVRVETSESLQYVFDTPWGPPEPIARKLAEDWPMLHFGWSYDVEGFGPGTIEFYY